MSGFSHGNKTKKEIYDIYDEVLVCSNGFYNVRLGKKWGYLDDYKKQITQVKYEFSADYEDGLAIVFCDGRCYLLDMFGREITTDCKTDL